MNWTSKKYSLDKGYPITRLQQCQHSKAKAAKAGASGSCHARDSAATAGEHYSWQPRRLEKKSKDWVESMKSEWGDILSLLFFDLLNYMFINLSTYQHVRISRVTPGTGSVVSVSKSVMAKVRALQAQAKAIGGFSYHPKMTMRSWWETAWHECEKLLKN